MLVLKNSARKSLAFILTLTFIMSTMFGIAASAETTTLTADKNFYLALDPFTVTVAGVSEAQMKEQGAFIGIYLATDKPDANPIDYEYVRELKDFKTWKEYVPNEFRTDYVFRLCLEESGKVTILNSFPFTVGSNQAAEGAVTLSKASFLANEPASVIVTGLTDGQLKDGAWIGVFTAETAMDKDDTYQGTYEYIRELRDGKTWNFNAPFDFGNYEIRVFTKNNEKYMNQSLYAKIPFTIGSSTAKEGDIKLSSDFFLVRDPAKVEVKGLTDEQVKGGAWVGIFAEGTPIDKDQTYQGMYEYIRELKDLKTWEFNAPSDFGNYEMRVYTKNGEKDMKASFFGKQTFKVGSNPAKDGDLKISADKFLIVDPVSVTIQGLTEGQIKDGAFAAISKPSDAIETGAYEGFYEYVRELRDGKTWEFKAPNELGSYEVRIFTKNTDKKDLRQIALFGKLPFEVVSNPAKKGDLKINKQFFKKGEQINTTITGLSEGQLKNGAWAGVYKLNDAYKTEPINGMYAYIKDLRDGKTWSFIPSLDPGKYEIRVFTQNVNKEDRESVFFGRLTFTIENTSVGTSNAGAFSWSNYTLKTNPSGTVNARVLQSFNIKAYAVKGTSMLPVNNLVTYSYDSTKVTISKTGTVKCKAKGTTTIKVIGGPRSVNIKVVIK